MWIPGMSIAASLTSFSKSYRRTEKTFARGVVGGTIVFILKEYRAAGNVADNIMNLRKEMMCLTLNCDAMRGFLGRKVWPWKYQNGAEDIFPILKIGLSTSKKSLFCKPKRTYFLFQFHKLKSHLVVATCIAYRPSGGIDKERERLQIVVAAIHLKGCWNQNL